MEVDTKGLLMREKLFWAWFLKANIDKSGVKLWTLSAPIKVIGFKLVQVFDKNKPVHDLDMIICITQGHLTMLLLGRDRLDKFSVDWKLAMIGSMHQSVNVTKETKWFGLANDSPPKSASFRELVT